MKKENKYRKVKKLLEKRKEEKMKTKSYKALKFVYKNRNIIRYFRYYN